MSALLLAWRTVRRYRAQTLLAIAGVAVIGALLFDMLLLSRGLLLSFADLLERAGYDVRVVGGGGMTLRMPIPDSAAIADTVRRLPEIEKVALVRILPARLAAAGGTSSTSVALIGVSGAAAGVWTIVRGVDLDRAQGESCPVIVGRSLAARLRVAPGDEVRLNAEQVGVSSALPAVACRIAGVGQFAFGGAGDDSVATTLEALNRASGEDRIVALTEFPSLSWTTAGGRRASTTRVSPWASTPTVPNDSRRASRVSPISASEPCAN